MYVCVYKAFTKLRLLDSVSGSVLSSAGALSAHMQIIRNNRGAEPKAKAVVSKRAYENICSRRRDIGRATFGHNFPDKLCILEGKTHTQVLLEVEITCHGYGRRNCSKSFVEKGEENIILLCFQSRLSTTIRY